MNYNKADFIASYGISSQLPESDRPELSFSGRSNVGKSSLINKLCSRKNLARVASTPGKTATINFYSVDDCYFVDLPGVLDTRARFLWLHSLLMRLDLPTLDRPEKLSSGRSLSGSWLEMP